MRSGERIARFRASLEQEKNREQKGSELEKAKPNPSASSDQQAGGEAPAREKALQKFKKGKGKPTENGSTGTEPTRQRQDLPTESAPARLTIPTMFGMFNKGKRSKVVQYKGSQPKLDLAFDESEFFATTESSDNRGPKSISKPPREAPKQKDKTKKEARTNRKRKRAEPIREELSGPEPHSLSDAKNPQTSTSKDTERPAQADNKPTYLEEVTARLGKVIPPLPSQMFSVERACKIAEQGFGMINSLNDHIESCARSEAAMNISTGISSRASECIQQIAQQLEKTLHKHREQRRSESRIRKKARLPEANRSSTAALFSDEFGIRSLDPRLEQRHGRKNSLKRPSFLLASSLQEQPTRVPTFKTRPRMI